MAIEDIRIDNRVNMRIAITIGEVIDGALTTKKGINILDIQKQPLLKTNTAEEVLV